MYSCLLQSLLLSGLVLKHRFRLAQPNKVYIGGLPENTHSDDLQNCFGKLGNIVNIELKYVFTFQTAMAFHDSFFFVFTQDWIWLCGKWSGDWYL